MNGKRIEGKFKVGFQNTRITNYKRTIWPWYGKHRKGRRQSNK